MKFHSLILLALCVPTVGFSGEDARGQDKSDRPAGDVDWKLLKQAVDSAKIDVPAQPSQVQSAGLQMNQPRYLHTESASRAVTLNVHSVSLQEAYGPLKATAGHSLLVVDAEWQNIIPMTLVQERQIPTEYRIPNLGDHLYAVVNRASIARIAVKDNTVAGHLVVKDFKLPRIGDIARGNIVFDVPSTQLASLELRFYDFAHGHMTLPLIKASAPAVKEATPTLAGDEVIEAGVYGFERLPAIGNLKAPPGMTYAIVQFRARSLFSLDADATAFDPKAKPGSKMKIGTVTDWTDAMQYATLVVDGEYGYPAIASLSTIVPQPRFLPDVPTGGSFVFLAPAEATSIELCCDFPNAKSSAGQVMRPKGFSLPIQGVRPQRAQQESILKIEDKPFIVTIDKETVTTDYAGMQPKAGLRYLVLDVSVTNQGEGGEFFQTREQLKFAGSDGKTLTLDDATYRGVHQPAELVWIPAGERRSFQTVFAMADTEVKPRLAYSGITLAKVFDLPSIALLVGTPTNPAPVIASFETPAPPQPPVAVSQTPEAPEAEKPAPEPAAQEGASKLKSRTIKFGDHEFPARVSARQPGRTSRGLEGVGLNAEMVNKAIDRGAEALWKWTKADMAKEHRKFGSRREDALIALALIHADWHRKAPDFDAHLRGMIAAFDQRQRRETYEMGLSSMMIEAYDDPTFAPQLRSVTQWLLDTQGPEGTWGYGLAVKQKLDEGQSARRPLMIVGGHPPDQPPAAGEPLKRIIPWEKGSDGDNSVTQYALLGLHSASRLGIKLPPETFQRLLKETLARRSNDGGWGYHTVSSSYGSMTCAGICAVALSRFHLGQEPYAESEDIERGLAWLNANFMVNDNPEYKDRWVYYYLYSLERVGRILDTEFIGEHEWYPLGSQWLLQNQRPDGMWFHKAQEDEENKELPTSFALLFLTRATATLNKVAKTGPGTLKTAVVIPPGNRVYLILDCSGSMMEEMGGKQKFEIAKDAVRSLLAVMPDSSEVALRAYGYRLRAIEPGADEDSKLLIPLAKLDRKKMGEYLDGLRARGKTPLALSLSESIKDIQRDATANEPITAVLLTDGGEDSVPRRDPVKAAVEFAGQKHVNLRIVGFDINRDDWNKQLQEMTRASGGQYLRASQAGQLSQELKSAVFGIPESFDLCDKDGNKIQSGAFGLDLQLPAGKYTLITTFSGRRFAEPLWISPGETTSASFNATAIAEDMRAVDQPPVSAPTPAPTPPANPPTAAKFCSHCGTPTVSGAKFCAHCGAKIE